MEREQERLRGCWQGGGLIAALSKEQSSELETGDLEHRTCLQPWEACCLLWEKLAEEKVQNRIP